MKKMLQKDNGRKRSKLNMNIHKSMVIPDRTCKKKLFVTVNSKYGYKIKVTYNLWLPFIYQKQLDVFYLQLFILVYRNIL